MQASLHQELSNTPLSTQRPKRILKDSYSSAASSDKTTQQDQQRQDQEVVHQLQSRDREVRAHEAAHIAAGRPYVVSGPTYTFERGPDGRNYAIGGKVELDVSEEPDPQDTLRKMEQVRRAALAPAQPSPEDNRVAAHAQQMAARARLEIAVQNREEQQGKNVSATGGNTPPGGTTTTTPPAPSAGYSQAASATRPYITGEVGDPSHMINQFV